MHFFVFTSEDPHRGETLLRGEGSRGEERGERSSSSSFVVSFLDRKAGSKWDMLSQCVRSGKCDGGGSMVKECNVFINFQLTERRAKLAKACRQARYNKKVFRDRVDANGKITVKIENGWFEVKNEKELDEIIRQEDRPGLTIDNREPSPDGPRDTK